MCVCVFESGTLGLNHVSVIDRACSCLIVARLIKLTLTRLKMLPSRMAHILTFHISMLLNWRKADTKVSEVMVFRDSTISKEVCRPQYMKVICDEELFIVKVFAQKRKNCFRKVGEIRKSVIWSVPSWSELKWLSVDRNFF